MNICQTLSKEATRLNKLRFSLLTGVKLKGGTIAYKINSEKRVNANLQWEAQVMHPSKLKMSQLDQKLCAHGEKL